MEHLKSWDKKIKLKELKYIPTPLTWISQERWRDEVIYDAETISHHRAAEMRDKKQQQDIKEEEEKQKNLRERQELDRVIESIPKSQREDILTEIREKLITERPSLSKNVQILEHTVKAEFRVHVKKYFFNK
jgi:hypothetical protein